MSSPALIEQPAHQTVAVPATAPADPPRNSSNDAPTHTISIRRVPHIVWTFARQNAEKSGLPFRYYLIRLFAASGPLPAPAQPGQPGAAPPISPGGEQTVHTVTVQRVPYLVWAHVRNNAMLSQRTFSNYLIELLEQSSPLPITLGGSAKPQPE